MSKRKPRVEKYEDSSGEWRWRLVAANGEIIATGESYVSESSVNRAIKTVIRAFKEAEVELED